MKKYLIKTKLNNGLIFETPPTNNVDINKFIKIIQDKTVRDEDFNFTDIEKKVTVKAKDIKSIEIEFV